jgi:hypothetical protein
MCSRGRQRVVAVAACAALRTATPIAMPASTYFRAMRFPLYEFDQENAAAAGAGPLIPSTCCPQSRHCLGLLTDILEYPLVDAS